MSSAFFFLDRVWIVILAFYEQATIRGLAEAALKLCLLVLVVDDGSHDATSDRLQDLPLTLLRHDTTSNAASLRTAFVHALAHGADCAITLDGDGQHDPADLPRLLAAWRAIPPLVIGSRLHDRGRLRRAAGSAIASPASGSRGPRGTRSPIRNRACASIRTP